ncbi:hypothetical protein OQA88_8580 [Cercophora sp. LCS_1]
MSASMLRGRAVPILATVALGGGIYYSTAGGRNEPRQRTQGGGIPVSETLEGLAGSGGPRARHPGELAPEDDPKNPRNKTPMSPSKRNPDKKRDL